MATYVLTEDPSALTGAAYFDGTDAGTSTMPGLFTQNVDPDENLLPAEEGATGLVGPITGAQHAHNAAMPGGR